MKSHVQKSNGLVDGVTRRAGIGPAALGLYALHSWAALALEIIWMKFLSGTLGMTATALSLTLVTFLAGLGCGSLLLPSLLTRCSPFLLLALIEGAIGGWAIGFPLLIERLDVVYSAYAPAIESLPHQGLRSIIAAGLLLPVTTLIGTGFPLLAAIGASGGAKQDEQQPGMLYFAGLGAAALGALSALQLIPTLGLAHSSAWVGAMHLVIALGAFVCHKSIGLTHQPRTSTQQAGPQRRPAVSSISGSDRRPLRTLWSAKGLAALIGFEIMGLELIGAAYLWLMVNTTVYAEATVLAAVLLAMAAGGALYRGLRRRTGAPALIGGCLLLGALGQTALLVWAKDLAWAFDRLIQEGGILHQWIQGSVAHFSLLTGALAIVAIGAPVLSYSLAFSSLCELSMQPLRNMERRELTPVALSVGSLYAWHNWGGAAGVLITWLVLLPLFGLTTSFLLLTLVLLAGFLLLPFTGAQSARWKPRSRWMIPACGLAGGLALLLWVGPQADLSYSQAAAGEGQTIRFHAADGLGLVEVAENRATGVKTLLTNRLRQEGGSSPDGLRVQRLQGYLPILLHPNPHDVLVIGLGTGIALSATLRDEVARVTTVEISPAIVDAAKRHFGDANGHVLDHPKVRLVQQDGRNFIKLAREQYDVIVQELFFPYQSGVGSLYTREHYGRCRDRLASNGLMAQWITINQLETEDLRVLVRTFLDVFPYATVWLDGGYLALIGGLQPFQIDLENFLTRHRQPDPLGGPASLVPDPLDFFSLYVSGGGALHDWSSSALLNTDDNLLLEYRIPQSLGTLNSIELAARSLDTLLPLHRPLTELVHTDNPSHQVRLAKVSEGSRLLLEGIVTRARGQDLLARTKYNEAFKLIPANYQVRTYLAQDSAARGRASLVQGDDAQASEQLSLASALNPDNPDVQFDLAALHARRGQDQDAVRLYRQLLRAHPEWPHRPTGEFNLGVSLYRLNRYEEARETLESALRAEPLSIDTHFTLANSLAKIGAYAEAAGHYREVLRLDPDHPHARANLAEVMENVPTVVVKGR
jgi:spermidine synthase